MKKTAKRKSRDTLRTSYKRSDFPGGLARGKYAARLASSSSLVRLDPEIQAAFPTSQAVNEALRGLLRVAKGVRLAGRSSDRRTR